MAHKLIVVSMDALFAEDLTYLSQKPSFAYLLKRCAMVQQVKSIYPTLTYPCHATMATGCFPKKHGIVNNTHFVPGDASPHWIWYHDAYQVKDLHDACKEKGLTTASVGWPSTGNHPHIDYLVDEIAATKATTDEEFRRDYLLTGTPPELWDAVCAPHIHLRTQERSVFKFNAAACCEIIRRYAPDFVTLHVGEPDHSRHLYGISSEQILPALDLCEQCLTDILQAISDSGCEQSYNLVVTADHCQMDVTHTSCPNALFAAEDLLTLDADKKVADWCAWSHNTGMSATVYVKDPADEPVVYALLKENLPQLGCSRIYTRDEAAAEGFAGHFSFVLETDGHTRFEDHWDQPPLTPIGRTKGCHGFHPEKGHRHPLLAIGPAFMEGAVLPHAHLTDGAPTWAAILGVSLPDADGSALLPLLRDR